ncbi:MAG: hypothetical protein AAF478_09810 [Pseudomonadota bacterium]
MTNGSSPFSAPTSLVTMFVACFVLIILFASILQQIGAPLIYISLMMMVYVVGLYLFSGLLTKTMRLNTYLSADKTTIPFFNGMAVASGVASGGMFILYAGYIYTNGTDFLVLYLGILIGIAFLTMFFSANIARSRSFTLAGMIFPERSPVSLSCLTIVIVVTCSALMLLAQVSLLALIVENFYQITHAFGAGLVIIVAALGLVMGGMQSLSIVRILAYPVIALALFIPIAWASYNLTGNPVPQLAFGEGAVSPVTEIDRELLTAQLVAEGEVFNQLKDNQQFNGFNFVAAILTVIFGFSVMPHLLQHFTTVQKGRQARKSGIWAFAMIALILTLFPAAAAFTKLDLYSTLLGLQVSELGNEASWIFALSGGGNIELIKICGELVSNTQEAVAVCSQNDVFFLSLSDISINTEMLMVSFALLNDLPALVTVILVTGALLAIFSTVDGLLLVVANTLTADFYQRIIRPKSPPGLRLFMSRFFLLLFAVLVLLAAPYIKLPPEQLFYMAVAIAAASLFPALLLRVWFENVSDIQIGWGMIVSFVGTTILLVMTITGPDLTFLSGDELILQIPRVTERLEPLSLGLLGAIAFFAVSFAIGLISNATNQLKSRRKLRAEA